MATKTFVCPNCNATIEDFDTSTGTATCPYCGSVVTDSDFATKKAESAEGQGQGAAPVYVQNVAYVQPAVITAPPAPAVVPSGKNQGTALILCYVLGMFGGHRFYTGKVGTGIIWLFTAGCFFIGWIVDAMNIASGRFTDAAGRPILPFGVKLDPSDPNARLCSHCGSPIGPSDQACKNCGTKVRSWWQTQWGAAIIIVAIIIVLYMMGAGARH